MADPKHLRILDRGVDAWNEWRLGNPGIRPDLSDADHRERANGLGDSASP